MKSHLLENSKLMPKDAFTKEVSKVSSKHLPKNYIFKHSTFYKRNYKERYLFEAHSLTACRLLWL